MTRRSEYLVVDLETVPDTSRWARPEAPPGKDAPFPPTWAHRIVVIGCMWLDADYRLRRLGVVGDGVATGEVDEAQLLEDFGRFVGRQRTVLVTYNGRSFDLPVIALRALCHGVPLPWYYQERGVRYRYSEEGHIDLCDWLTDHGATRSGSLDAIARLIGLPGKVGVDGSQVEGLYLGGRLDEIQRYCLADVVQTAFVFLRFRLLQGALAPAAYRAAVEALLEQTSQDARVADVVARVERDALLRSRGPMFDAAPDAGERAHDERDVVAPTDLEPGADTLAEPDEPDADGHAPAATADS